MQIKRIFLLAFFTVLFFLPAFSAFNIIMTTEKTSYVPGERITVNFLFPGADDVDETQPPIILVSFSGAIKKDTANFDSCGKSIDLNGEEYKDFYQPFGGSTFNVDSTAFILNEQGFAPANVNFCPPSGRVGRFLGTLSDTPGDYVIYAALHYQTSKGGWVSSTDLVSIHIKSPEEMNNWLYSKIMILLAFLAILIGLIGSIYREQVIRVKWLKVVVVSSMVLTFIVLAILLFST